MCLYFGTSKHSVNRYSERSDPYLYASLPLRLYIPVSLGLTFSQASSDAYKSTGP